MLPSLRSLVRERALLDDVLQATSPLRGDDGGCPPRPRVAARPRSAPPEAAKAVGEPGAAWDTNSLQQLPREVLTDMCESFLDARAWHACKLGEASQQLSQVFLEDEAVWRGLWRERFREASRSPNGRAARSPARGPSVRLSYVQAHLLEARFRGGRYEMRGTLDNPHEGVAVLDVRMAPSGEGGASSMAFAALRNGSIAVYDLDPAKLSYSEEAAGLHDLVADAPRAAPMRELAGSAGGEPALCCLPIEAAGGPHGGVLVAGYALGRLAAWADLGGRPCAPRAWEDAHNGRVTALVALEGDRLFSAASDGLVKAWSAERERFGEAMGILPGHQASVVSVAASPHGANLLLSGSHDRTMRLWDVRQGGEAATVAQWRQKDWVTCVDFHPTSEHRILSSDKGVHLWDLRRPGAGPVETLHRHRKLVSRFRVDPLRLASCSLDGCVKVSSLEEPGHRVASPRSSPLSSPAMRPSSPPPMADTLFDDDGDVCTLRASTDYVLSIDFDATRLLAGSADGVVHVYDFSERGHFRRSSPVGGSPALSFRCGEPVDLELTGLQEIEVA